MKIAWSVIAELDLNELHDYIARDVPYYAEQFIGRVINLVDVLKEYPLLGRRVPEAKECDDVRELIFQGYRLIYLVRTDEVYILTVIHGSRNLATLGTEPWVMG